MSADLRSWSRAAVATSRTTGAPPLPLLLGLRRVRRTQADLELRFDPHRPAATAPVGLLDVAVLADFALGGALRARLGAARVLPTVTLTLQLACTRPPGDVRVSAWGDEITDGLADASGEVVCGERVIGSALATFAAPDRAGQAPALPWEEPPRPRAVPPHPTPDERFLAADLYRAAEQAGDGRSWAEELLARACRRDDTAAERALLCRPTAVLCNRTGDVQGGVLFGLAMAVAAGDLPPSSVRLVSGHMVFAAPASADAPLRAVPTSIRETRRTRFVRSDLLQGTAVVATATFTLRKAG